MQNVFRQEVLKAWGFMMHLNLFGCGSTNREIPPKQGSLGFSSPFGFSLLLRRSYLYTKLSLSSFFSLFHELFTLQTVSSLGLHLWKTLSRYQSLKPAGFPNPQIKTIVFYMALSSESFADSLL